MKKFNISDYLVSLYNNYNRFLNSLSVNKIVCMFEIIINSLILSFFLSVLIIMLSTSLLFL